MSTSTTDCNQKIMWIILLFAILLVSFGNLVSINLDNVDQEISEACQSAPILYTRSELLAMRNNMRNSAIWNRIPGQTCLRIRQLRLNRRLRKRGQRGGVKNKTRDNDNDRGVNFSNLTYAPRPKCYRPSTNDKLLNFMHVNCQCQLRSSMILWNL